MPKTKIQGSCKRQVFSSIFQQLISSTFRQIRTSTFYQAITQVELAKVVGLSRTHISNLEAPKMRTSISLEKLFEIADALDVPVKKFFDFRE